MIINIKKFVPLHNIKMLKHSAMRKLAIGSKIPDFSLNDQFGNEWRMNDQLGKSNMVIYFYPKDDTPGCTAEACSFRDHYNDFLDTGAKVVGISSDSVESHLKFATKHNLSFTLLSDEGGKLRKQFGVPTSLLGLIEGRVTYVIDKEGKVRHIFNSQLNAKKHVSEALNILGKI
jgi:peroxiredoxin Q/BCP